MTAVKEDNMDFAASQPPLKKMKQARLPFKVISPKVGQHAEPTLPRTPPSNKKRKLSDTAPGPNKASKTPRGDENGPKGKKTCPKVADAENEVSSSSEADVMLKKCSVKIERCKKAVFMDQYVRKAQQLEVSTTNLMDTSSVVGLTDSNDAISVATDSEKPNCLQGVIVGDDATTLKSSELCDTSSKLSEKVIEENKIYCDSTENKDEENQKIRDEENQSQTELHDDIGEDEPTSIEVKEEIDVRETDVHDTSEVEEVEDDTKNDSMNETAESEKEVSILSDSSPQSQDDSVTEETDASPTSPMNSDKTRTGSNKKPKTPASTSKIVEREAEKLRRIQEKENLKLEKQKEKDEKERIKKEEKEKREKEKDDAKKKREQGKKEKVEQKEREKQEKLKQKEEERKKKEEEKQKKQEEKQKELEEKQRQKEEKEKEKEDTKPVKVSKISEKQVTFFSSFFTKKEKDLTTVKEEQSSGNFIQFELKAHMRLAPTLRRQPLDSRDQEKLDTLITEQTPEQLYLRQLKKEDYQPGKGTTTWPSQEDDVMIMEEDGEKSGLKFMKAKFLSFHENNRPPYRGTWNKKSKVITARKPLSLDKELLDYEVDSDDEWEEEDPGESVSDSGGEEDEAKDEDEEEEDGFFVPHGYLSEGEGCEDDDDVTPERIKAKQLARANAFEVEMKRKTELLKPVCIGCCWWEPDQVASPALDMLHKFKVVGFDSFPINLMCNKYEKSKKRSLKDDKKKLQPQNVPEEAIPDLIRLVHGNRWSVQKLIREFREYWRLKCNSVTDNVQVPEGNNHDEEEADTSQNEDMADGIKYSMSKRQVDKTIKEIAVYERRNSYPKSCWYVHDAVLEKTNLKDLNVPTQWVWVTKDPQKPPRTAATTPNAAPNIVERSPTPTQTIQKEGSIMKFAKPGISPKFPVRSPKPLPSACSTPLAQGKGTILTKFKQDTPKTNSVKQRISLASRFQPIEKTDEVSSSDCAAIEMEAPSFFKPVKNQPTVLSLFKGSAVCSSGSTTPNSSGNAVCGSGSTTPNSSGSAVCSSSSSKPNSSKAPGKTSKNHNLNNHISLKKGVASVENNMVDSTAASSSSTSGASQGIVLGSAECPMDID